MGATRRSLIPFFFFLLLLMSCIESQPSMSIYDHLQQNGLPMGLLPKGITDFWVEPSSGVFRINLTQPCDAHLENQLHYDLNITGVLSFGNIRELSGVSQQDLFLWFPVNAIRVDLPTSGLIHFDVGVVHKQFSLSLFEIPLDCEAAADDPHSQNQYEKLAFKVGRGDVLMAVS